MMKPIDTIYNSFINDRNQKIRYTVDYPTNLPNTGSNSGPNMHWVMLKPDPAFFESIANAYLSADYSPTWRWNNQGVKDFDGILGVKGFLAHYFSRVETGKNGILQRCVYGNDNSDPYAMDPRGNAVCRDPNDCQDCRAVDFNSIKVAMTTHGMKGPSPFVTVSTVLGSQPEWTLRNPAGMTVHHLTILVLSILIASWASAAVKDCPAMTA